MSSSSNALFELLRTGIRRNTPPADYIFPAAMETSFSSESLSDAAGTPGSRCLYRSRRPRGLDDCVISGEGGIPKPTYAMICHNQFNTPESQETEATTAPSSVYSEIGFEDGLERSREWTGWVVDDDAIRTPRASRGVEFLGHPPTSTGVGYAIEAAAGEPIPAVPIACRAAIMGKSAIPVYGNLVEL